jgi:glycosyltransferase involved in cell wall biosynthesis
MQILHIDVDDIDNPKGGGQGRRTAKINEAIADRHQVTVLSCGYPGASNKVKFGCKYEYTPNMPFPLNVGGFITSIPFRMAAKRFDLVVEDFTSPISTSFTPLYTKKPVIGSAQFLFAGEMAKKYHLPFDLVERIGLKYYKYLIAMTDDEAAVLRAMAPQATVVTIPEGIEEEAVGVTAPRSDYIAFMGRLDSHQKGIDRVIEIAKLVDPLEIRVAGDGPDRQVVEEAASRIANLKFVGKQVGPDRLKFLAAARATLMPSRYETFGMVAIESLAVGTPVVCSNIPNLSYAAGPLSVKCPEDDLQAYATALKDSPEAVEDAWIEAAKTYAAQFFWPKLAERQLAFYEEVLDRENRP